MTPKSYALVNAADDKVIKVVNHTLLFDLNSAIDDAIAIVNIRSSVNEIVIIPITSDNPHLNAMNDPVAYVARKSYYTREIKSSDTAIVKTVDKVVQYDYKF